MRTMADPRKGPADERRAAFAARYLANGRNATEAAIFVGCSPRSAHSTASKWLRTSKVREIVGAIDARALKKAEVTVERVIFELHDILTADIVEAIDPATNTLKPLREWPESLRRALSGIDNAEIREGGVVIGDMRKVRFWSKTDAADKLLKHLGGYAPDKLDITVSDHADRLRAARARRKAQP